MWSTRSLSIAMIMSDLIEHASVSVRNPWYFNKKAYGKNSDDNNNVITDSMSSK